MEEALILDIQRMSTEDGPGLRTTVFFKGCNLNCGWCHNPESISKKPEVNWYSAKCIGCNICLSVCGQGGIYKNEGLKFKRHLCLSCGKCEKECPNAAIEMKGKKYDTAKLLKELVKDRAYFGRDGGVTLSGGEVMMQPAAAAELVKGLKAEGVGTAVDTAGCYDFKILEEILPYTDIILYDIKIFDNDLHKKFTGVENKRILENYIKLKEKNARVWVRTPIIENATDGAENIQKIGEFLAAAGLPEKWELCAFNNLCRDKYERLDREWEYKNAERTKKEHIEALTEIAKKYVPSAIYSGMLKEK
ncbi:MAG: glycyl-radical enzyme activating protein [Clostridiales bacterium]|jgi:pyruvate formate lyase activating enzyme|nr:glycyl-radical enzyme activating protein [Clostridiales bacterium]